MADLADTESTVTNFPPSSTIVFRHWRGRLSIKNKEICTAEIRTNLDSAFNVANMDCNISISSCLAQDVLHRQIPTSLASASEKCNVTHNGRRFDTFIMYPTDEGPGFNMFQELVALLVQEAVVAFIPLRNNSSMYLLPTSRLTVDLGLSEYHSETGSQSVSKHGSNVRKAFLHVIIITPETLSFQIKDRKIFNIVNMRKHKEILPMPAQYNVKDALEYKLRVMNIEPSNVLPSINQDQYEKLYHRINEENVQDCKEMLHAHYTETVNMSSNTRAAWFEKLTTAWVNVNAHQERFYSITKRKMEETSASVSGDEGSSTTLETSRKRPRNEEQENGNVSSTEQPDSAHTTDDDAEEASLENSPHQISKALMLRPPCWSTWTRRRKISYEVFLRKPLDKKLKFVRKMYFYRTVLRQEKDGLACQIPKRRQTVCRLQRELQKVHKESRRMYNILQENRSLWKLVHRRKTKTIKYLKSLKETKSDESITDLNPKNGIFVKMASDMHHRKDRLPKWREGVHYKMIPEGQAVLATIVRRKVELKPRFEALSRQHDQLKSEVGRLMTLVSMLDLTKVAIPPPPRTSSISRNDDMLCEIENLPPKKMARPMKSSGQDSCSFLMLDFDTKVERDLSAPCGPFAGFKRCSPSHLHRQPLSRNFSIAPIVLRTEDKYWIAL